MKTGAEAIRALATQLPAFRQKLSDGWYQVRIAGRDVSTSGLTAQLHETLPDGAVIHIVPRVAGAKSGGVFQIVLGAAAIAGSFFTAGATLAAWGAAIGTGGMTGILFSLGASMVLGGVAQMLAPKARTPRTQTTDNGKQNTYFSSLDNMVAQGNVRKRAARTVLTGMCYSVGSATRQGSSSPTRFIGQSAMTSRT